MLLGSLFVVIAVAMIIYGVTARDSLRMSLGWHIWSTIGWIVGSIGGVLFAQNLPEE
jgi:multidrug transporter EmrE-like cation transporter